MSAVHPPALSLGGRHAGAVAARLRCWEEEEAVARLWAGDHTLWTAEQIGRAHV